MIDRLSMSQILHLCAVFLGRFRWVAYARMLDPILALVVLHQMIPAMALGIVDEWQSSENGH